MVGRGRVASLQRIEEKASGNGRGGGGRACLMEKALDLLSIRSWGRGVRVAAVRILEEKSASRTFGRGGKDGGSRSPSLARKTEVV